MSLWLERRDDKGNLIYRSKFTDGSAELTFGAINHVSEAIKLAKASAHLPLNEREWVLRVVDEG